MEGSQTCLVQIWKSECVRSVAESTEHSARQKQLANVSLTVFPDILYDVHMYLSVLQNMYVHSRFILDTFTLF